VVFLRLEGANETLVFRAGKMETWPELFGAADEPVFSADGTWVAVRTRGEDRTGLVQEGAPRGKSEIFVRRLGDGVKFLKFAHEGPVHAVSPDGSLLLVRDDELSWGRTRPRLIDSRTGRRVPDGVLAVAGPSQTACFSRDGRLLAIATDT